MAPGSYRDAKSPWVDGSPPATCISHLAPVMPKGATSTSNAQSAADS